MSLDPHVVKVLDSNFPYIDKSPVIGKLNCLLHTRSKERQMEVSPYPARAVLEKQIHELVAVDVAEAVVGRTVNHVAYLAFFEVHQGGMILIGDQVEVNEKKIGQVAGFDLTHLPNHINILIGVPKPLKTGYEIGLHVGDQIHFNFIGPQQFRS